MVAVPVWLERTGLQVSRCQVWTVVEGQPLSSQSDSLLMTLEIVACLYIHVGGGGGEREERGREEREM